MTVLTAATAERARTWPRVLASAAALWVLLDAVILFGTFPYWPRSAARWTLLIVAGPAMYLALAGLLELAIVPRLERLSSTRHAPRWLAGALGLLAVAGIVALCAWWTLRVEA